MEDGGWRMKDGGWRKNGRALRAILDLPSSILSLSTRARGTLVAARSLHMPTLMHFKIVGTEHATSARRTVELDAPNHAPAEKQAHLQGVDEIIHVEQTGRRPGRRRS
jgi:hypothetical protein